ncbi:MAG: N-acetylneuraminate synthase family protein [Gammaproteobacteria bacterium]
MFHIDDRLIGDGAPCYVTFEIGPTHNGIQSAKRLIKHAADAGADAVKFQIFDPDRLVADKQQLFSYGVLKNRETGETETVEEPLYDILKRRCLSNEEWREIKAYCDSLNVAFFATVGFDEDVDFLIELNCHSIKIASADVNHFPLLRRVARTGMCVQLDTGMATLGEIEAAVDIIRSEGNENIIIHQCPSGYPARLESINLNIIPTLKRMFPYPVAFSDHTPGSEMDIAAVAMGANLVEKTITEDRATRSVEHIMSIEPPEMKDFVRTLREIETAMGNTRRVLHEDERVKRNAVRRSVFLKKAAKAGEKLCDCEIEFRRPGYGIAPDGYEEIKDAVLRHELPAGHMLTMADLLEE